MTRYFPRASSTTLGKPPRCNILNHEECQSLHYTLPFQFLINEHVSDILLRFSDIYTDSGYFLKFIVWSQFIVSNLNFSIFGVYVTHTCIICRRLGLQRPAYYLYRRLQLQRPTSDFLPCVHSSHFTFHEKKHVYIISFCTSRVSICYTQSNERTTRVTLNTFVCLHVEYGDISCTLNNVIFSQSLALGRRCPSINRWRVRNVRGGLRWPRWRVRRPWWLCLNATRYADWTLCTSW